MNNVIHIGHCLHAGENSTYNYAPYWQTAFRNLPYFYSIAVIRKDNPNLGACATVLVKCDMGPTADETKTIYASLSQALPTLYGLPPDQVDLRCTKITIASNTVPLQEELVKYFESSYASNPPVA